MAAKKKKPKDCLPSDKTVDSRIKKRRSSFKPVRRFENDVLDVGRKRGKYSKIIKQNAHSPLLRLPPEIRNQIWQMVLGGKHLSMWYINALDFKMHTYTAVGLKHASALLRTCRQIYAEAVLYPYQSNIFVMSIRKREDHPAVKGILRYGEDNVRQIQFETCMRPGRSKSCVNCDRLPKASSLRRFAGLRRVIIRICHHDTETGMEKWKRLADATEQKLLEKYTRKRKDIQVVFERGLPSRFDRAR
ncbi:hypothetical protein NX059_003900 [Plenodomus lindquistii]|nr:hypothetical protein NX059_003900 [Plenodomus lindquistii]